MASNILLINPPGWDACATGPYAAGPYLGGYLKSKGVECVWRDLNIEIANRFADPISAGDAVAAVQGGLPAMDHLYAARQAKLAHATSNASGVWFLREGFQPAGLDNGSSASLRASLDRPPPYAAFLDELVASACSGTRSRVVAITITVPHQLYGAFQVAAAVRRHSPDVFIVAGGNIVTRLARQMALPWVFDWFDALAVGQGEQVLVDIANAADGQAQRRVTGLITRHDGEIEETKPKLLTPHDFAPPDYSVVNFDQYWGFPYATIMASRGCYYGKCAFCAIPYTWGPGGFLGNDEPHSVVQTMMQCVEAHDIRRFKFVEESLHPRMVDQVSRALIDLDLKTTWEGYARMDAPWFDEAFLARAARAGLKKVYVGLELLEGPERSVLSKQDRPDADGLLRKLHDAGILVHLFVLVGHPGTSIEGALRTLDFALERQEMVDTIEINGFRYEKHTNIDGLTRRPHPARDWSLDDPYDSRLDPTFSPEALDELERQLHIAYGQAVPRWTHPIYFMTSPWSHSAQGVKSSREPVAT